MRLNSQTWRAVISSILLLLTLLLFISPAAAQTSTQTTDTPQDIARSLGSQGYYVSQAVQSRIKSGEIKEADLEKSLAQITKDFKDKKHDTRIVVLSNELLSKVTVPGANTVAGYAGYLQGFLNNPKPEVVVVVNAASDQLGLAAEGLSAAENTEAAKAAASTFASKGFAQGSKLAAQTAIDKIDGKATGGLVTTLVIILLIVLVVGGFLAFRYISTRDSWKKQLSELQGLAGQVSNQVLKLSDTIEYLPDAVRTNTRSLFGQASTVFSNANTSMHELQKANPWSLMFKGGEYQRQLQMTASQFQTSRNTLAQVQQTVDNSTHM